MMTIKIVIIIAIIALLLGMLLIGQTGRYNVKLTTVSGEAVYFEAPVYAVGETGKMPEMVTKDFTNAKWAYRENDSDSKYWVVYEAGEKSNPCLLKGKL